MADTYTVGIIGCGGIAPSHYKGFTDTGRARVTRVWDIDAAAMQKRAAEWGAQAVRSGDDLIDAVDIVVIASPGFAHREYVEAAAAAGKAVLCEKPIALNLDDALAMKAAVERAGVLFLAGFIQRYDPLFVQLKQEQAAGRVGGVVSAWATLSAPASSARWRDIQRTGHWRSSMELSGGRINEFCSHTINWLLWVLGRPRTVYGKALYVTEGFSLDDSDYALIECAAGVGLLNVNRHAGVAPERNYGIMGHAGSLAARDEQISLTLMDQPPRPLPVTVTPATKHEHFLACLERGETPLTGMDDAIDTLRVCLAFNRSAQSGKVEAVD